MYRGGNDRYRSLILFCLVAIEQVVGSGLRVRHPLNQTADRADVDAVLPSQRLGPHPGPVIMTDLAGLASRELRLRMHRPEQPRHRRRHEAALGDHVPVVVSAEPTDRWSSRKQGGLSQA